MTKGGAQGGWGPELGERTHRDLLAWLWPPLRVLPLLPALLLVLGAREGLSAEARNTWVLDRIVMVVNGEPITASRVELYAAWLKLWGNDPGWPERLEAGTENAPVEVERLLSTDELLYEAATSSGGAEPSDVDVAAAQQRYQGLFSSAEAQAHFERQHELSAEAVRGLLVRRLRISRLVSTRLGTGRVTEGEITAWYQAHAAEFPGKTLAEVKSVIVQRVKEEQLRQRFEKFSKELRDRATIQVPSRDAER